MTRRKDGLWQQSLIINGKRKYFYGRTKTEVLKKISDFKDVQERGKMFETVADEWWADHESKLAYNTVKSYKPAKERAIQYFINTPIKEIMPIHINQHIKIFAKNHADKTVRTQLMVYNLIFKYAVECGHIPFNPARDISVPNNLQKKKISTPSPKDIQRVKDSTDCTFGMFAYWALYTGLRRGELLALEWADVDMTHRVIHITKSLYHENNKPRIKLPKTHASLGTVPILDALAKKIEPQHGLVFPNEKGEHITETQFQRLWELYCAESGVSANPHQFRHAYATMLFEAGIPPEEMQILLRHAQLSTTMDIYRDIRDTKVKAIHSKIYEIDIK